MMKKNKINFLENLKRKINNFRQQIDNIDQSILELINKRLELVKKIGRLKRKGDWCVSDNFRENEILCRLESLNKGPLKSSMLHSIFDIVIKASRKIQTFERVVYMGPKYTLAHLVALKYFTSEKVLFISTSNEINVLKEVDNGFCDYGLISFGYCESISVRELFDFFSTSNIGICGKYYSKINYELISKGIDFEKIKVVYITKDLIKICCAWVKYYLPNVEIIECLYIIDGINKIINNEYAAVVGFEGTSNLLNLRLLFSSKEFIGCPILNYLIISKN